MRFFHNIIPSFKEPKEDEKQKIEEKPRNYEDKIEKLRVKYGKEKRFWDMINVFLIIIILVWVLLFVVYYVQGKINWNSSY
jgi:lipopolysaccharide/colanic/teichoic acid biosynthesis glycosyltransferase